MEPAETKCYLFCNKNNLLSYWQRISCDNQTPKCHRTIRVPAFHLQGSVTFLLGLLNFSYPGERTGGRSEESSTQKLFFFFILNILISIWNLLISYCVVPSSVHLKQAWQKSVWLISVQCHEFRCVPDMFRPIWEATGTPWLSQTARSAWCHDWHRC